MEQKNRNGLPTAASILISVIVSVLSALSLLVFHYLRNCEDAVSYYTTAEKSLIRDALSTNDVWFYIPPAILLGVCFFLLLKEYRHGVRAAWLTSLPLAFNMVISLSMEHSNLRKIFLPGSSALNRVFVNTLIFLGFSAVLSTVISLLFCFLDRAAEKRGNKRVKSEALLKPFAIAYILIFAGWIPALVMCFPGSLDMDALGQIKGYMGVIRIDAANPILPTLFYGWMFKLGRFYGRDDALTFFKIVILQDVFNAGFMALVCVRTYRYTKSKAAFLAAVVFCSLMPMWQRAAQHILKDVLHTGWYLAFYLSYLSCLEKERLSAGDAAVLCFCCIMISFTRSGVYIIAVLSLLVLLLKKEKADRIKLAVCLALLVSLYFGVVNLVYPRYEERIKPPREVESYSMQLQQIALYCVEYGDELSEDEIRIINDTLNYETIVKNYTPMNSDPVKAVWHGTAENHDEFWALYRKLIFRHPLVFAKEILMSSFEHFNPWYSGNRNGVSMSKDPAFHQVDYANLSSLLKMVNYWNSWLDHPVSRVFYGNGLYAWILIVMLGYAIWHRSAQAFWGLVPQLTLMVGLFMSHVNGLLRYGYPLIAAAPLICGYVFFTVSQEQAALIDAPPEYTQSKAELFLPACKASCGRVLGKAGQFLKNAIRNICYFVLHLLEDKKK